MPIAYHQPEEDNNIIMDCLIACIDSFAFYNNNNKYVLLF